MTVALDEAPSLVPLTAAITAIDDTLDTDASDAHLLMAAKCRALMVGYHSRWAGAEWQTISAEETVTLPVVNPETGHTSRNWLHASKHDGIIEGYGKTLLLEHKTTSDTDIANPSGTYWRRLTIDSQVSKYALDNWQMGRKLDGALYDVILKPGIRPKSLSKKVVEQVALTRRYEGFELSNEAVTAVANGLERESIELYELRLTADVIERADRYYQRRVIHRLDSELAEYAGELWQIGKEIRRAQRLGRHYRNSAACMAWGRECEYLGICSGSEAEPDEGVADIHGELDGPSSTDQQVLTNSRISMFLTCRRKHHYSYNLGIKRQEENEALWIGTTLHLGLEAYWRQLKGVVNDYSSNDAVNGIASTATAAG